MRILHENKRCTGKRYEEITAKILEKHGYQIIEKNYWCPFGEIDLIALQDVWIVFIEVKYRKNENIGRPEQAVGRKKQQTIKKTANWYLESHPKYWSYQMRFDVAAILGKEFRTYPNAF